MHRLGAELVHVAVLMELGFLAGGEKLADRGRLDPLLAMWAANAILTLVSIPLLVRTVREASPFAVMRRPRPGPAAAGEKTEPC